MDLRRLAQRWLWRRSLAPIYGLAIGLVAALLYWPGMVGILPIFADYADLKPLDIIDLRIGDMIQQRVGLRRGQEKIPKICVVGITADCLNRYGSMPWPRSLHGEMVERLRQLGAQTVAFDIFFPNPTPEDAAFAARMRRAGNVILPRCGLMPDPIPHRSNLGGRTAGLFDHRDGGAYDPVRDSSGIYRTEMRAAAPLLYSGARDVGHINIFYDGDLVARRVPMALAEPKGERTYLPIGVVAALHARGQPASSAKLTSKALTCGDMTIPLDARGCMLINYQSFERMIDTRPLEVRQEVEFGWSRAPIQFYSYRDVHEGRVSASAFDGAVVLVGQCVWGSREDLHLTPQGSQYGVLVQAMLLHTVLTESWLKPVAPMTIAMAALALSLLLGTICFSFRLRGSSYAIVMGGCLVLTLGVALTLTAATVMRGNGLVMDVTPFLMVIGLNLAGGIAVNAARITREADRRTMEMDMLLVAGRRHINEMPSHDTPACSAIPGASQMAISASLSLRSPEIVAETFWQTVPSESCVLFVIGQSESLNFERTVFHDHRSTLPRAEVERIGVRFAWETLRSVQPVIRSNRDKEWNFPGTSPLIRTLMGVPIVARGQPLAVVVLFNKRATPASPEREFTDDHLRLVAALRYQAAALLENARRYQLEYAMFDGFARSLATAVDFRDRYTRGHSERVAEISAAVARELGLTDDEVEIVQRSATLHDLGKIGVNDAVLRKPGRLSEEEFAQIRAHAQNGFEILKAAPSFEALLPGIRNHHERYDGKGYPDGLMGNGIPLLARIIATADAYDAMTSDRPYRKGLPETKAREELRDGSGTQFDPVIVEAMLRYLGRRATSAAPESTQVVILEQNPAAQPAASATS